MRYLAALLFSALCFGQAYRVDPVPVYTGAGNTPPLGQTAMYAVPGAIIAIYIDLATTIPATTYTNATGTTACPAFQPVTQAASSQCTSISGPLGQFGFWLTPGTYYFLVQYGSQTYGPYSVTTAGIALPASPNFSMQYNDNGVFGGASFNGIPVISTTGPPAAATGSAICPLLTLTGDVTTSSGCATTLATVNPDVGTFTNPTVQVDAKGRVLAISSGAAGGIQIQSNGTNVGATTSILNYQAGTGILYTLANTGTQVNAQGSVDTSVIQSRATAQAGTSLLCTGSASTTATCAMTPTLTAYTTGMVIQFSPGTAGTGSAYTLNVDTLGAKNITECDGSTNPSSSDLVVGQQKPLAYDGTVFRLPCVGSGGGGGITALTGDVTASGSGSVVATLATVNSHIGTCGDATHVGQVNLNAKGLTTACTPIAITGGSNSSMVICPGGCGGSYGGNLGGSTNQLFVWAMNIPTPAPVATITYDTSTASNQAWAIYSISGSLLATGSTGTGCGGCAFALNLPYTFTSGGAYFLAFCASASTNISTGNEQWLAPAGVSVAYLPIATAANSCAWSGSTPNFPSTLGVLTVSSVGYAKAILQ